MRTTYLLALTVLYPFSATAGKVDDEIFRGKKKEREEHSSPKGKTIEGQITFVLNESDGIPVPVVNRGKGFKLKDGAVAQTDVTMGYTEVMRSLFCNNQNILSCPNQVPTCPFSARQVVLSGTVVFNCPCSNIPIIFTGLQASELEAFNQQGFFNTFENQFAFIQGLTAQINNVSKEGFRFDIIMVLLSEDIETGSQLLNLLLPTLGFNFRADCCIEQN